MSDFPMDSTSARARRSDTLPIWQPPRPVEERVSGTLAIVSITRRLFRADLKVGFVRKQEDGGASGNQAGATYRVVLSFRVPFMQPGTSTSVRDPLPRPGQPIPGMI